MKRLAIILVLMGAPVGALAYTGNDLLEDCGPEASSFSSGVCAGYITGVISGIRIPPPVEQPSDNQFRFPRFKYICTGNGVTNGQMRDVVLKRLRENPESRNEWASTLIYQYLSEAFPCE